MGYAILHGSGGGGVHSEDVTAGKEQVLSGYTAVTTNSNDEVVGGTMVNRGAVTKSLGINGSYTIPAGYHNGSGVVSQSIATKDAETYYPGTSDQTIAAKQYLTGAQVIKKLTQSGLASDNILRGKTISIHNGNANVWSVTGSESVLRYISGQSKGSNTGKSFRISGADTNYKWFYYIDVNPGFTPVFSISASNGLMFRTSQTTFNYADSGLIAHGTFVNASDAPFSSTQCRIFFPQYDSSAPVNVWYWIFGY